MEVFKRWICDVNIILHFSSWILSPHEKLEGSPFAADQDEADEERQQEKRASDNDDNWAGFSQTFIMCLTCVIYQQKDDFLGWHFVEMETKVYRQ